MISHSIFAQDACSDLFAQGYYDEHETFSDRQNFKYIQSAVCSDDTLTRSQANDRSLGSGGSYYAVITGFLNLGDQQKSFEEQRRIFCAMSLDASTSTQTSIYKAREVSHAAASVMKACFNAQGFHAAIVPSRNPESFAIKMSYHGEGKTDILVDKISSNPPITCDTADKTTVTNSVSIICHKPATKTIQVTMRTDRGQLPATDVLGTKDINEDIRAEMKSLSEKVSKAGQSSCLGCIEQSVLTEAQFQNANGSTWCYATAARSLEPNLPN